jgi:pyridoxal/pyridoxine/pyridoxamine kinase
MLENTFVAPSPMPTLEQDTAAPRTVVLPSHTEDPPSTTRVRPTTKLERALEAWNAGHQSVRALAAVLSTDSNHLSNDEAYRLICQLDARGLITRHKRMRDS